MESCIIHFPPCSTKVDVFETGDVSFLFSRELILKNLGSMTEFHSKVANHYMSQRLFCDLLQLCTPQWCILMWTWRDLACYPTTKIAWVIWSPKETWHLMTCESEKRDIQTMHQFCMEFKIVDDKQLVRQASRKELAWEKGVTQLLMTKIFCPWSSKTTIMLLPVGEKGSPVLQFPRTKLEQEVSRKVAQASRRHLDFGQNGREWSHTQYHKQVLIGFTRL